MSKFAPSRFLVVVLLLLLLVAAWLIGRHQGTKAARPLASAQVNQEIAGDAAKRVIQLEAELVVVEQELQAAESLNTASEQTVASLQLALEEALERSYEDDVELELYRKIASAEENSGLGVESVVYRSQPAGNLSITLIQWNGRASVNGEAQVVLELSERKIPLATRQFDFRFFQTLDFDMAPVNSESGAIESIDSMQPLTLEITLIPDVQGLNPVAIRVPWSEVRE